MASACPVAGYINHVMHWRVQFSFVLGSVSHFLPLPPPPRLCWFFSTDVFSVTGACSFPFPWGLMVGLRCCASHGGIISISGLAASSGSPWILQAPNLHLAMQLFSIIYGLNIRFFALKTKSKWLKEWRDLQNFLMAILPSRRENNTLPLSSWGKT